ncbi:MAG TPA: GPW/gp25 family protein [Verrucomicrobiae bacterium]|nr:GPW/gp25 family protein [Verrucomicrobiae bacterium]
MAEPTPFERLQPCLLDRLTDDEPAKTEESRNQRVISQARYKRGVLRDLEWLFNASAHLPEEGVRQFRLSDYPEAHRSVINFGTRQLCGMLAPNMDELERELAEAVRLFEPRIINHTLTVKATVERHLVTIEMFGELWANPVPEKLFIKTSIDLETGQCSLGDGGHG